jgi:hypothetical protein
LIRSAAIRQAGLVRSDEFRAAFQVFGWLGKLLQWGNFIRVPEPLYYRLDHGCSYTRQYWQGAAAKAWTTLFTGVLDAAMRFCRTPQERLFFQQTILDRFIAYPPFRDSNEAASSEKLAAECLERLKYEGNVHLLDVKEFPSILEELQCRVEKIRTVERSLSRSQLRTGIFQIWQRYRFAKVIYPGSPVRRVRYQVRYMVAMLGKIRKLLLPK